MSPRQLLLTRPIDQSHDFAEAVERRLPGRFEIRFAPLLRIEPSDVPIELDGIGALAFTSANGVMQFVRRSQERSWPAYCVGEITAEAARKAGFRAYSADGNVSALGHLIAVRHDPQRGDVLHVRGTSAAGNLAGDLAAHSIACRAAEIYTQVPCPLETEILDALVSGQAHVVALFSPRTAEQFDREVAQALIPVEGLCAVCLSPPVAAALVLRPPGKIVVSSTPSREDMIEALARL